MTQPLKEYIYSGSQLLATIDATTGLSYQFPDHLSTRVEADANGAVTRTFGHFPFGEVWYETGTASKWKFITYERDSESELDYVQFRFDSSRLGRFMSPDLLAGDIGSPESMVRYSYAGNDPINLVDPSGLRPCMFDSNGNCTGGSGGNCAIDGLAFDCGAIAGLVFAQAAGLCWTVDCSGFGTTWKFSDVGGDLMVCISCGVSGTSTNGDLFTFSENAGWLDTGDMSFVWELATMGSGVQAANNGSLFGWDRNAWKAFGGSLFSWKNFSAGFKEGGCFRQFAEEAFDPAEQIAGTDQAIEATAQSGAYVTATAYAASRALVVPMRSSVVRGILDLGETAGGAIALGATIYSEGTALVNEVKSFYSGQCQ